MTPEKQYADPSFYEKKLAKVMDRLGVDDYDWDYNRSGGWVQFHYKGQLYRFEHSVENAKAHGQKIIYGSDVFAQIVLGLEDLARLVERGIYDLQTWVEGLKALPPAVPVPSYFAFLGFDHIPENVEEVNNQYRKMVKIYHPDKGGNPEDFQKLTDAKTQALQYFSEI